MGAEATCLTGAEAKYAEECIGTAKAIGGAFV